MGNAVPRPNNYLVGGVLFQSPIPNYRAVVDSAYTNALRDIVHVLRFPHLVPNPRREVVSQFKRFVRLVQNAYLGMPELVAWNGDVAILAFPTIDKSIHTNVGIVLEFILDLWENIVEILFREAARGSMPINFVSKDQYLAYGKYLLSGMKLDFGKYASHGLHTRAPASNRLTWGVLGQISHHVVRYTHIFPAPPQNIGAKLRWRQPAQTHSNGKSLLQTSKHGLLPSKPKSDRRALIS
jgi:hypothetical protein